MTANVFFWLLMVGIVILSYGVTFKRMTKEMNYQYSFQGFAPAVIGFIIGAIIVYIICTGVHFSGIAKALGIIFPV